MRVTCTYHCAACEGHFHSEAAFVTHRAPEGCLEPMDDERFLALSHEAKCELQRVEYTPLEPGNRQVYPAGWRPGDPPLQRVVEAVTVWTLRAAVEAARAQFPLKGSPPGALGAPNWSQPPGRPGGACTATCSPAPRTRQPICLTLC
jgi:hypothetical protein